jgi:hypothetical protein
MHFKASMLNVAIACAPNSNLGGYNLNKKEGKRFGALNPKDKRMKGSLKCIHLH